ncbi:MAG: hypothetical protein UR25_C0003G0173 [Candidatus Nomurabacteria bacterium GW2011_GWE1_32_28]|uniref:UPF0102 protein UR19_C0003G0226 n=1 Tax=Candidatus Nomurabacteria bacterium GW2011_GWF1_31_48 TaxID=1618767 RepID=A0A0G0AUQ1_9BACT|nr:MAG: hypothetical protein UR10_C0003G0172 [Candidatus Nomurabacteria bacterium GW2011_GWF2_30_133]KKP28812.1 MAG: hypothetical protein UR18_C0002G0224 [Candidatus Nomurabacteria bacterium GW2011_GWE2_31_40]KKP30390.1 MAG: hypothetical protein UR19_C0003G0226 [Candidatus Nomurabacteria bacterium GW2011_GWF1_31_48]KKP34917.1 MAG: hypothetical protein UR25_C0003G0173 [Candidatus Nomurabacteria bacterium GW2011_GWE1_32_28]HAS81008.1 hypothetical protein [Candidatus Nomurabacteria bacterium]
MPKVFTSETQKTGEIGESIATRFLMKHNFSILDRNYTKKWGEIDIVAEKEGKLYFVEVKSVSCETLTVDVTREPLLNKKNIENIDRSEEKDSYRAEDNMHPWKMKRLSRTIQTYLLNKNVDEEKEWQVDLLVVYLCPKEKKVRIKVVSDIIL